MSVTVPPEVADTIRLYFDERGERWLDALPRLVERLCGDWDLEIIGESFSGGTHSFVAPVRRADGSVAVLKAPVVDEGNAGEPTALYCYAGDGAVRLYEFDSASGAMLLEWARPGTPLLAQPGNPHLEGRPEHADKLVLAGRLYQRLRRPLRAVPAGFPPLPTLAAQVRSWAELVDRPKPELAEVLPPAVRERAIDWCRVLAVPQGPAVIVNRDTHLGNIVAAEREPWLLIDPQPYLGEAAFDAGYLALIQIQSTPTRYHADAVVARTADLLGVNSDRVRGWALLRAVEEIDWALDDDDTEEASRHLAIARALA
ncbi:aminoglycoside phosphotransferase family protein [Nocardia terpenica]|uniref:Phosphotransferase n=1 Tax=Nocardia terpenica TaxID=455432 RepID=A0A6G9Z8W4_9NOCA|nr:aminoglycoside phosphotransferase family protein [Nocardia terpenica]QIS21831.1 phosphotransferase [Nocardia terpenica]